MAGALTAAAVAGASKGITGGLFGLANTGIQVSHNKKQQGREHSFQQGQQGREHSFQQGQQQRNQSFVANQADIQRQHGLMMDSTAYSRKMQDLKNSGVNPLMALGGIQGGAPSAQPSAKAVNKVHQQVQGGNTSLIRDQQEFMQNLISRKANTAASYKKHR